MTTNNIFRNFDPPTVYAALGELPLAAGDTEVTSDSIRLLTIFLTNKGAVDRRVTVTNAAGVELIGNMLVPAYTPLPALAFSMMLAEGLNWYADGADVNGQVEGWPNETT